MMDTVVFLDTDIGMDCDDAGALAVLHHLAPRRNITIGAMVSSAPLPASPRLIDCINASRGNRVPVGRVSASPAQDSYQDVYAGEVLRRLGMTASDADFEEAVPLLRRELSRCADHSVIYAAIGPQTNMAALLRSPGDAQSPLPGGELLKRKLKSTVVMAGRFVDSSPEFNVVVDVKAAQTVAEGWPGEILYVSHELGAALITGTRFSEEQYRCDPVAMSYAVHSGHGGRYSWDPIALYQALWPDNTLFAAGEPGTVTVGDEGVSVFSPSPSGRHRLLRLSAPVDEAERLLSECICAKEVPQ